MQAILIPVKRLNEAKARLGVELSVEERHEFGLKMLSDVLNATLEWRDRWVVTSDIDAAELALSHGCALIDDPGDGLNAAVGAATDITMRVGADQLLVLPADVPLVERADVQLAFEVDASVGIAASNDGGTNLLLRRPPDSIPAQFGANSARRHAAVARAAGLQVEMIDAPSVKLDIDQPEDLRALATSDSDRASARYVRSIRGG
jgi:2-phospho-L-lactate guanylyltransferase